MKKMIILAIFLIINIILFSQKKGDFVVIIDPGHGGWDNGAGVFINNDKDNLITESAYCFDVALRLEKLLKNDGIIVFKTTKSYQKNIIDNNILEIIPPCTDAVFSFDETVVDKGIWGLSKRIFFSNSKIKEYPHYRIVFISIHFDISRSNLFGVRIIKGGNVISNYLFKEFKKKKLLSNSKIPILNNGDKSQGIRHLFVLGDRNLIPQKVIIELANLKNKRDLARLQNPKIRQEYALIIRKALEKYKKD